MHLSSQTLGIEYSTCLSTGVRTVIDGIGSFVPDPVRGKAHAAWGGLLLPSLPAGLWVVATDSIIEMPSGAALHGKYPDLSCLLLMFLPYLHCLLVNQTVFLECPSGK